MPAYYFVLRRVLRTKPKAQCCLTRCRECRIFFITHPCNAGRRDLRCPFGCREAHRKQSSTQRSVAYYQGTCGKIKKKIQNNKRRTKAVEPEVGPEGGEAEWDEPIVEYVRMVTGLIEGRRVSRKEILAMLRKVMRQHSLGRRRRVDYIVMELKKNPP